ncbi:MAG: hypothetical protein ACXWQO_05685 [Bdellovibrionota bacterium]
MRTFLLIFLFPILAMAGKGDPIFVEPGQYHYSHEFEIGLQKRIEIVYGFTSEGTARIAELRRNGYICNLANRDTYLCSAFETNPPRTPDNVESRVEALLNESSPDFGAIRGPAGFLRKSELNTEWTMPQSVDFRGKHYETYRFILSSNATLQKIYLGEEVAEAGFLLDSNGKLSYPMDFSIRESNTVSHRYFGEAGFSR